MLLNTLERLAIMLRKLARRLSGMRTRRAVIDGTAWTWAEAGPRDGEVVIMVHGFGGEKDNWLLFAPRLAKRYRVICPDLPGFGDSGRASDADYTAAAQARRVIRFADALGIGRFHLGGNSMGGAIALRIALAHPERLCSLTLLNNAGVNGEELTAAQQTIINDGVNPLQVRSVADLDAMIPLIFCKPPHLPLIVRRLLVHELVQRDAMLEHVFHQIAREAIDEPLNDRLGEIRVPTLVLWGDSDNLLHVSAAGFQHRAIPGSELAILDQTGHVPMVENPRKTVAVCMDFIGRNSCAASA